MPASEDNSRNPPIIQSQELCQLGAEEDAWCRRTPPSVEEVKEWIHAHPTHHAHSASPLGDDEDAWVQHRNAAASSRLRFI